MHANPAPRRAAFTLIELLVVIALIAILAVILIPAITGALARAKATQCAQVQRSLGQGFSMFNDDRGFFPPLSWATGTKPPSPVKPNQPESVVKDSLTWWPDLLSQYMTGTRIFSCPTLKTRSSGLTTGTPGPQSFGIGLNDIEIGSRVTTANIRTNLVRSVEVTAPADTVAFADAAIAANPSAQPGQWLDGGSGLIYFKAPPYGGSERAIPRHGERIVVTYVDGHSSSVLNDTLGWDKPRGDPEAKWDR
jgi:prepilin-type N-terminal cleavage/methylation domain-containing protein/prepilin-type processing-associated H-X9-DG protein